MRKYLFPIILTLSIISTALVVAWFLPRPYTVHYHANFALYMSGKQVSFSGNEYMEDVARCNIGKGVLPADRVHLHENKGDLVHVHMAASTWGHLFANLRWNFGQEYLVDTNGTIYSTNTVNHLYFFINGKPVFNPFNTPIQSEDRLLIWYGTGTEESIQNTFFPKVADDAKIYNQKDDPASCGTNEHTEILESFKDMGHEIKHALWGHSDDE